MGVCVRILEVKIRSSFQVVDNTYTVVDIYAISLTHTHTHTHTQRIRYLLYTLLSGDGRLISAYYSLDKIKRGHKRHAVGPCSLAYLLIKKTLPY